MCSFCQIALAALPLLAGVAAQDPASPTPTEQTQNAAHANVNEAFQDLINVLPEESLHAALNSLSHFRSGVFESDKRGVEHIHHNDPPLATKLIIAAVEDLKKRQQPASSNNGTTPASQTESQSEQQQSQSETQTQTQEPQSTNEPESSSTPESSRESSQESSRASESSRERSQSSQRSAESSSSPESSAVIIPVPVETTTDSQGRSTVLSSGILSRPTASVAVPVTRTNAEGSTEVATETKPAVIFSTTDSAGNAFETTSAVEFAPTKGQVLTTTDAEGSTFFTTFTPGSGRVSSIVLLTTTGEDGQPSVVTSYTYVDPQATGAEESGPGSSAKPSLQRGLAAPSRAVEATMLVGVLIGAVAIFI